MFVVFVGIGFESGLGLGLGTDLPPEFPMKTITTVRTTTTARATRAVTQKVFFFIVTASPPRSASPCAGLAIDESAVFVGEAVDDTSVGDAALRSALLVPPALALSVSLSLPLAVELLSARLLPGLEVPVVELFTLLSNLLPVFDAVLLPAAELLAIELPALLCDAPLLLPRLLDGLLAPLDSAAEPFGGSLFDFFGSAMVSTFEKDPLKLWPQTGERKNELNSR